MGHAWNQKVIQLLTKEFKKNVQACKYQVMTSLPENGTDEFIRTAIENKLHRFQCELRRVVRKMAQAPHLPQAEVAELIVKQKREALVRSRRNERKRAVSHSSRYMCWALLNGQ
jgi:hypothetical protein